jgi:hypothetical protein
LVLLKVDCPSGGKYTLMVPLQGCHSNFEKRLR